MLRAPARLLKAAVLAIGLVASAGAMAQTAICYNCPPEWADWASQLRAIKDKTGITVPPDNKNSGQTLAQLVAEKASPVADMAYYGVTFGIQAKKEGVTAAYKPAGWAEIPDGLKDADGHWFTIHSGTLGLFVNTAALVGGRVMFIDHRPTRIFYLVAFAYLLAALLFWLVPKVVPHAALTGPSLDREFAWGMPCAKAGVRCGCRA